MVMTLLRVSTPVGGRSKIDSPLAMAGVGEEMEHGIHDVRAHGAAGLRRWAWLWRQANRCSSKTLCGCIVLP